MMRSFVAAVAALAILVAPSLANRSNASAAPAAPTKIVKMSVGERVAHLGAGIGLIGGAVAGQMFGLGGLYAATAAIGISAAAAPVVIGAVLVTAVGFGVYELAKGILGKKEVADGSNVTRSTPTRVPAPTGPLPRPGVSTRVGGAPGAGVPH